jgi:hypothetical protein
MSGIIEIDGSIPGFGADAALSRLSTGQTCLPLTSNLRVSAYIKYGGALYAVVCGHLPGRRTELYSSFSSGKLRDAELFTGSDAGSLPSARRVASLNPLETMGNEQNCQLLRVILLSKSEAPMLDTRHGRFSVRRTLEGAAYRIFKALAGVALYLVDCDRIKDLDLEPLEVVQPTDVSGNAPGKLRMCPTFAASELAVLRMSGERGVRLIVVGERSMRVQIDTTGPAAWFHELYYIAELAGSGMLQSVDIGAPVVNKGGQIHSFVSAIDISVEGRVRVLLSPAHLVRAQAIKLVDYQTRPEPHVEFVFPHRFVSVIRRRASAKLPISGAVSGSGLVGGLTTGDLTMLRSVGLLSPLLDSRSASESLFSCAAIVQFSGGNTYVGDTPAAATSATKSPLTLPEGCLTLFKQLP